MGICFSDTVEPPQPPVKQYQQQKQQQQVYPEVKPSAPPISYPPPQQGYTYAVMPQAQPTMYPTNSTHPWATPMYQYNQFAGNGIVQRYVVQPPYVAPVQQQQRVSTGTAVAGGMLAGMVVADILNDDPY